MEDGIIELTTGVKLKVSPVSPMAVEAALRLNLPPMPTVPKVYIETKNREEDNPNDPRYVAAMNDYDLAVGRITLDFMAGLGTEIAEVPKGFSRPDATDWSEKLEAVGVPVAEQGLKRYIAWVNYWACRGAQDVATLTVAVTNAVGTPEAKVAEAADSFRNRAERRADRAGADKPSG